MALNGLVYYPLGCYGRVGLGGLFHGRIISASTGAVECLPTMSDETIRRIASLAIISVAVAWGIRVAVYSHYYDDPSGLFPGIPSIVLLVIGGAIWPSRKKR